MHPARWSITLQNSAVLFCTKSMGKIKSGDFLVFFDVHYVTKVYEIENLWFTSQVFDKRINLRISEFCFLIPLNSF